MSDEEYLLCCILLHTDLSIPETPDMDYTCWLFSAKNWHMIAGTMPKLRLLRD